MHGLSNGVRRHHARVRRVANWQVPDDDRRARHAFARMNNWSFWLLPVAATLLVSSFFVPGGAVAAGWTIYAPLSTPDGPGWTWGSSRCTSWRVLDHGVDQHHHHHPQHGARPG